VPFTLRNLRADLEDVGSNFDGAPDLEFRLATDALELEKSGLSYQSVPPTNRWSAGVGPVSSVTRRSFGNRCPRSPVRSAPRERCRLGSLEFRRSFSRLAAGLERTL
jgi:hypothetical protein